MPTIISGDAGVAGTLGILSNRKVIQMRDRIALLEPSANPLTLLLNKLRREVVRGSKIEWLTDEATPITDRVNNSGGYTAGATSIVVDNGDYFGADSGANTSTLVRVQRTGEVMRVTDISGNTLTVTRSWGGTAEAAVNDNEQLTILGGMAVENQAAQTSWAVKTAAAFNYTQIIRDPFGVSRRLMKSELYGGDALAYLHRARGIEHAKHIELALLFGERASVTSGNYEVTSCGGIDEFVSTYSTDFGGAIGSLEEIFTAAEGDFRYGKRRKMLFGGRAVVSNISLLAGDVLRTVPADKTFGIAISTLLTPHGQYDVVAHDLFEGDTYKNRALIVDMSQLSYRFIPDSDSVLRTNIQAPDIDGRKDEYLTDMGLERGNEKTHAQWLDAAS